MLHLGPAALGGKRKALAALRLSWSPEASHLRLGLRLPGSTAIANLIMEWPSPAAPSLQVRETDTRHGAPRSLSSAPVVVKCSRCKAAAQFGPPGALWPSFCASHAHEAASAPAALSPTVSSDFLNYALVYEELTAEPSRLVVDPTALDLAARLWGGDAHLVTEVPWYSEQEFRDVSLSKLLIALDMQSRRARARSPPAHGTRAPLLAFLSHLSPLARFFFYPGRREIAGPYLAATKRGGV